MPKELYLPIALLIPAGFQVLYYLFIFSRFAFARAKKSHAENYPPVSVIVCGRNEEENFKKNLPQILDQDYPEFEVVAVNDQSIDNTKDVLEGLQRYHEHLRLVEVEENERFWNGKKYGLTLGIKAATFEHMIFTDADCVPASKEWLREMASGFSKNKKEIVLGFGAYEKQKGLLNKLIRFETLQAAIQYFSWALWGMPYMGVGRNLAYTKTLFFANKGFVPHMHIPMGDDDLFINAAGNRKNSTAVFTPESFTVSIPETHYADWFKQKRRHIAVSKHYKSGHKVALGFFGFTQILFILSLTALFFWQDLPIWVFYGLGVRYVLQYLIFIFSAKKTKDWDVLLFLPFLEIFLAVSQVFILMANTFSKSYKWK